MCEQAVAVGGMQTRRGLVEDVEGVAAMCALEFRGEFDTLSFASGQLRPLAPDSLTITTLRIVRARAA